MAHPSLIAGAALAILIVAIPAAAQEQAAPSIAAPFGEATPVATEQLGSIAGQADVAQAVSSQNKAEVSRNSVSGSVTGTIGLGNAFQSMNGLSVLSANTGNNVAINSSLNVNIAIHP